MTRRAQFQAVLAGQTVARTAHFALHRQSLPATEPSELFPAPHGAVDCQPPSNAWIGAMVPKRWARRAVTRNAVRRQVYSLVANRAEQLAGAAHLVRLRSAFAKTDFPSATSVALKAALRAELQQLFDRAKP